MGKVTLTRSLSLKLDFWDVPGNIGASTHSILSGVGVLTCVKGSQPGTSHRIYT
jgi:hypothetical protein